MRLSNVQTTALTTAADNGGTLANDVKANTRASLITRGLCDDNGALTADGYAAVGREVPTPAVTPAAHVAPAGTPTPGNAAPAAESTRMRITGRRANRDHRRATRKAERNARRKTRARK